MMARTYYRRKPLSSRMCGFFVRSIGAPPSFRGGDCAVVALTRACGRRPDPERRDDSEMVRKTLEAEEGNWKGLTLDLHIPLMDLKPPHAVDHVRIALGRFSSILERLSFEDRQAA